MVCASRFPPREGMGFYVLHLSQELQSRGIKVRILTRGGPRPLRVSRYQELELWEVPFLPCYPLHLEFHNWFLNRAVRKLDGITDLFHVHSPLVPRFTAATPIITTVHSVLRHDVTHTPLRDLSSLLVRLQGPFSFPHERRLLQNCRAVLCVSEAVSAYTQRYYGRGSEVIYNGVDTTTFGPSGSEERDSLRVLLVCRLVPGKGLELLPDLARRLPSVNFTVAGDGPLRRRLERDTEGLKVEWLGHIHSRDQLMKLYRQATALLVPSHYEGFPTVALEALACGCPVVGSAVGGLQEIVQPPRFGWLFSPGNVEAMLNSLEEMLDRPEERRRRGEAGADWVRRRFCWKQVTERQLAHYERIL